MTWEEKYWGLFKQLAVQMDRDEKIYKILEREVQELVINKLAKGRKRERVILRIREIIREISKHPTPQGDKFLSFLIKHYLE